MDDLTVVAHHRDLDFTVVASPHSHHVDFVVYDIYGYHENGEPIWVKSDDNAVVPSYSLEDAEVYLRGSVKWDGCSNWTFVEQERCMLHACSRQGLLRLGEVLAKCWDMTAELCPNWRA